MKLLLLVACCLLTGCTDTFKASMGAYGNPGRITCYSGGIVIYDGRSTGRIETVANSDGWEFKDAATGHFIRVSGPCVIEN